MDYLHKIEDEIKGLGFNIISKDFERPWGGFMVINEKQAQEFTNNFFDGINIQNLEIGGKLSPKILIVNPNSKLSWQYHQRREEIWKVFKGKVGLSRSYDNNENPIIKLDEGDQVKIEKGERHRLIGLDDYAVLAEIWQHIDSNNPSDENDIVRLDDDYGR
tara:strand:- start:6 stop:488 length:483 start_codon:yes stop_codon:yes gene_type:complete